ncbi:MAG: DUF58 domain-containing protein [Bryobacterales bacterium]|nr:DUF58 domain-containing protein [Bryobacterales bacterium]
MGLRAHARRLFAGRVRYQVTAAGLLFVAAILLVGIAAFASANNLLFLLLAAMLATLMISGFVSRLSLAGLQVDLLIPEHVSARQPVTGLIAVTNTKHWLPSFSIHLAGAEGSAVTTELYFPVIAGGSRLEESADLRFGRRGMHTENSFQVSTRFPFGFTERRILVTLERDVLVYPPVEPRPGFEELLTELAGDLAAHYRGRGNDFYRIRPYEAFESARHVDWRATAHTGLLQVREFAREQEQTVEVFLDRCAGGAPDWFEQAVDCCAFITWSVASRGARVRLRTQTADLRAPDQTDIYGILKYLALVEPVDVSLALPFPDNDTSFQIVITLDARRAENSAWHNARVLAGDAFSTPGGGSDRG